MAPRPKKRTVRRDPNSPGAGIASGNTPTATTTTRPANSNDQGDGGGGGGGGGDGFTIFGDGTGKAYFIGVESGSDLETQGVRYRKLPKNIQNQVSGSFRPLRGVTGPKYQVGYLNSKDFAKQLRGKDPDVVEFYQQRLAAAGLLDSYIPGQLDKATKAAFKELMSMANQTGITWQKALQDTENMGGEVSADGAGAEGRDPFQAVLSDPAYLRDTFQNSVREIYGGDLPDEEVNAMVDAFRSTQMQKQQAAYNAEGQGGVVESTEMSPSAYATAAVKAKHPQQLDRVKFQDTFSSIMDTFKGGAQ